MTAEKEDPSARTRELLAQADSLRDSRRWPEAAVAYRILLEHDPNLAPVWVQLGHALKESGSRDEAEAAYCRSLQLAPDVADTHLQLGYLLKLLGRLDEAAEAFLRALRIDRALRPALDELIALGETWRASSESGIGLDLLQEVLALAEGLRRTQARLEGLLPTIGSLASFPPSAYEFYRRSYRVEPPPSSGSPPPEFSVVVVDNGNPVAAVMRMCDALERQVLPPAHVCFITPSAANAACFDRIRGASGLALEPAVLARSMAETWRCAATYIGGRATEWILLVSSDSLLGPNSLSWFSFATMTGAAAVYTDEDHVEFSSNCEPVFFDPVFKTAYDPLLIEQGGDIGSVLALRRDVLVTALQQAIARPEEHTVGVLLRAAAEHGRVGHIARVLSSRIRNRLSTTTDRPTAALRKPPELDAAVGNEPVCVIISTRNAQPLLQRCINTLRQTAHAPEALQFLIIDNGSQDPETIDYLKGEQCRYSLEIIQSEAPFNWSLFNNSAVIRATADILTFVNNDIEMLSPGWDSILRYWLRWENIGIVGAKLLYPDRTVQHAGIVFGSQGLAVHEAVGELSSASGPQGRWSRCRRAAAVTGAFLGCRRADFHEIGGFDAHQLPIWFSDIDFCLKMRQRGRHVLFEPAICAVHHESKTMRATFAGAAIDEYWLHALEVMRARWRRGFVTDPGFNPHYSRWGRPFAAIAEPSLEAVLDHLRLSGSEDPWLPPVE
jgi:GT2 family glycosyltransferase/tetratricopeptide (TPR) repeat protein